MNPSISDVLIISVALKALAIWPLIFVGLHSLSVLVRQARAYTRYQTGEWAKDAWLLRTIWHEVLWSLIATSGLAYLFWSRI